VEILIVAGTLSGLGGIEVCIRSLAEEAEAAGDTVRVLALCPSLQDSRWQQGLHYSEVENGAKSMKRQVLRGLPAFIRACRSHPPDAVVVIYSSTLLLARLGLWMAGLRRPVLAWLHFSFAHRQRTSLLPLAHGHLCIWTEIAEATRAIPGVRPESVHLVYNGTNMKGSALIPRGTAGPLRLVHIGRLMREGQKRTGDLLCALARVEGDWRLELIGPGYPEGEVEQLQALAAQLGVAGRLSWRGHQVDPWSTITAADVLVLCSSYEGFPLVLLEAMARGVPCISSDCRSGPADIVRPGENGWLFEVGDLDALTGRIQSLVDDRSLLPAADTVRRSVRDFSSTEVYRRIRAAVEQAARGVRTPEVVG
jgi:UDP-D-galactose:(glucosyl)LPS alpha-1,6-D-galactosyltransferase